MLNIVMIKGHRHHGKAAGSYEIRGALELVAFKEATIEERMVLTGAVAVLIMAVFV